MSELKMSLQELLSEKSSFTAASIGSTPRGAQAIKFTDDTWSYKTHLRNAAANGLIAVAGNEITTQAGAENRVLAGNQRIFVKAGSSNSPVPVF